MKKEFLLRHIEAMEPEQVELLGDLLKFANDDFWEKDIFYRLCGITNEERSKIDSAFPCDYAKSIREIYPDFKNGHHCFDYSQERIFGRMRNLNNDFVKNLRAKLKIKK